MPEVKETPLSLFLHIYTLLSYREGGCGGVRAVPSHSPHEQRGTGECPWCHCPNSSSLEQSTLRERKKRNDHHNPLTCADLLDLNLNVTFLKKSCSKYQNG